MEDKLDTGIAELLERKAERDAAKKQRKEDRVEAGIINSLLIEREPSGLYYTRYALSGPVPEELKGKFTSKHRILEIASRRNIPVAA